MLLSFALKSDIHLKSIPATPQLHVGVVCLFCTSEELVCVPVVPGRIPASDYGKIFLRSPWGILWNTCPRCIPFLGRKGELGKEGDSFWCNCKQEGCVITRGEDMKQSGLLLKHGLSDTDLFSKWLRQGFLVDSLAVGHLNYFGSPVYTFLLLVSLQRYFIGSVSPLQVEKYFRDGIFPFPCWSGCTSEPVMLVGAGCWAGGVGQAESPGDGGIRAARCRMLDSMRCYTSR